jgi:hypothetical protein
MALLSTLFSSHHQATACSVQGFGLLEMALEMLSTSIRLRCPTAANLLLLHAGWS